MGSKRKTPGINGSSSADIAFMLLIFFLITTSMDTDKGLARRFLKTKRRMMLMLTRETWLSC
jgi:biopolymer transport protein ExbD